MLSIVVYGRNDSHGYNLHKRAALSLNSMAEQLRDDDDEIIFVDYNTPDEIPTFPEAISDTLTETTKRRLRVIRVRPAFHAKLGLNTRLAVLEPHARNIGFRRSSPRNRWVLSTNTDMLFVPKKKTSLTDVVAELEDGFYHLPRFELPEGFWESLPRSQPVEAIRSVSDWATRFHLNEITYGDFNNLYEAPGDFQLFLRSDVAKVSGFDESMVLGWHVDSNMAKRMFLHRGEVNTLEDQLCGYHCGHTRQATIYHSHTRTENDLTKYIRLVNEANLHSQRETWGAPDLRFEELTLDAARSAGYFSALKSAIPLPADRTYEGRFPISVGESRDQYDVYHILPYLCDLLTSGPERQKVLFLGSDATLLEGLHTFLSAAGVGSVVVCDEYPLLQDYASRSAIATMSREQALAEADCFVLQFPEAGLASGSRKGEQWRVIQAVEQIAEVEWESSLSERRRVVVVNSNDNPMQPAVEAVLSYTVMPYSCRIRHGYVIEPRDLAGVSPAPGSAWSSFLRDIHREIALSPLETEYLLRSVDQLAVLDAGTSPAAERLALEVEALANNVAVASELGVEPEKLERAAARARLVVAQAQSRFPSARGVGPRVQSGNRVCSGLDWEDTQWRALLNQTFYGPPYGLAHRRCWTWARISIQVELERHLNRHDRGWVLVVAQGPDVAAAIAAMRGFKVAYGTPEQIVGREAASDWTPSFKNNTLGVLHEHLLPYADVVGAMNPSDGFGAVVLMEGVLENLLNSNTLDSFLAAIGERRATAALLAAPVIRIDSGTQGGGFSHDDWRLLFEPDGALAAHGLKARGAIDDALPLDMLVKCVVNSDEGDGVPGLSFGDNGILQTVALVSGEPIKVRSKSSLRAWLDAFQPTVNRAKAEYLKA
jgi:hypothetical protein